jgi:hypothetical protein
MSKKSIKQEWDSYDGKRGSLKSRTEDYARWTLPWLYPSSTSNNTEVQELPVACGSIGARSTNHLSNKLVSTLFVPYRPFFRLLVDRDTLNTLLADNPELNEADINLILSRAESDAMQSMNVAVHRTQAVLAAKHLIVTGNTLLYYPEDLNVEVYGIKDYVVRRDLSSKIIHIITRDTKAFSTFSDKVQAALREGKDKKYEDDTQVELFTSIKLEGNKYIVTQAADTVQLDTRGEYPANRLPWIVLTWNLVRGEDYGRGLVEDYAYAFHTHAVLTAAQTKLYAIAADIKFLINPASMLDVDELVRSDSGSYHPGKEGDIWIPEIGKRIDLATIDAKIQALEREIAQAFLLNSAVTRDAERVTAEEIRMQVQELETSHGGIYSRLAAEWQTPMVGLVLKRIDFDLGKEFVPQIITGMESLSRNGDLENMQLFIADLANTANIPERFQRRLDESKFISTIGALRNVEYESFLKSDEQVEQEDQLAMQQQAALLQADTNAKAQVNAAGQLAKEL